MTISPADNTMVAIRKKVRRLTASSGEAALSTDIIDQAVNTFYNSDFPYAIKMDQMKSIYTFFTEPYRDRYPVDVNYNQSFRAPIYVEGIQGNFFKDRQQFFALWPRFPTQVTVPTEFISGTINGIIQPTDPAQILTDTSQLTTGDIITLSDIGGMVELNDFQYTITVVSPTVMTLDGVNNAPFTPYTSGGVWSSSIIDFTIAPTPFLSREVVLGGVDIGGSPISVNDDGNGNMQVQIPNPVVSVPANGTLYPPTTTPPTLVGYPIPGMKNLNTLNPGLNSVITVGAVDYVSGNLSVDFSRAGIIPDQSVPMTLWVSQYQTGRPYSVLYWNNELTIRPVPKEIHKVEVECYLTPVQFMEATDSPILNQWWQYIAYGASMEILRERQDMEGVENLREGFMRQESLVLERQANEEIFVANQTIFNTVQGYTIGPYGTGSGNW